MRVVVTGGRNYKDVECIVAALDDLWYGNIHYETSTEMHVASGDANGADLVVWTWAACRGIYYTRFAAAWGAEGLSAGPRRNARMLHEFEPDIVLAFPGGRGTADCVKQARAMGIEVREVGR